ncbi:hypothetical protein EV702DRAFT_1280077 [Suillus placidus]|uniref:F-box domain-containing protein n=1 Tax=Suillus placidus TaxID=48579 RepID=A0A9P6ZR05_9AGAM|nr:hypothetical protein EV702DRAFT_1280077 [Suillus placidus]
MTSHSYQMVETISCPSQLVKRVVQPKAGFQTLAEELKFYIMSFLSCRDILRCASVCKALRQTYISSSELQYIIELKGQHLLPVANTENRSPISKRLNLLRDRAHAWFDVDFHSFETVTVKSYSEQKYVVNGHLYLWDQDEDLATIIPIFPKLSQQTIQRNWSPGTLCSVSNSANLDVFMDPAQNLKAVVYKVDHETLYIDLGVLDHDSAHPQAAGRTLYVSGPPGYDNNRVQTTSAKLSGCGRHIALQRSVEVTVVDHGAGIYYENMWQLQIWDWQHSTTSNSVLSVTTLHGIGFCFLGNKRILVVADDNLKLYSIEDISQTPQFLACFLLPLPLSYIQCLLPMDDIEHHSLSHVQPTMYTSDAKHRLICLISSFPTRVFIISTRIFFNVDGTAAATPIPWNHWGPSNARIFEHHYSCKVHVCGNRVLQAFPVCTSASSPNEYVLHMMDFSLLAVTNRRGLGRVVKETSSINFAGKSAESLTISTSLPYVEVVSDRKFSFDELKAMWIDKDRIYLLNTNWTRTLTTLEVINV